MNRHRITTDLRDGGLGLRQIWRAFITRWISIGQQEIRNVGPSEHQLSATQYKYLDAVRALGGTAGQRISRPWIPGLCDCESSEEDPEQQAGRLQVATHRLSYDSITQPDEPLPEETQKVTTQLSHTQNVLGVTVYYTGHPTTSRWYGDGSKRHGRAGGGIRNGEFRAAFRVHGARQVYRAEKMACAVASHPAQPGDEIILDNQGVVKGHDECSITMVNIWTNG